MANTMEAAPRNPTQETRTCCFTGVRNQDKMAKAATGRATNSTNKKSSVPGTATSGKRDGKASRPRVKNRAICISHDRPSKKGTNDFLRGIWLLPRMIPATYTHKYPLPPTDSLRA